MPISPLIRRRGPLAVLTVAVLASASAFFAASPSTAAAADCAASQLDIVAHPDDDLLFQSPDLVNAIQCGTTVTTVYATAGDDGETGTSTQWPDGYWQGRELGVKAAYATMAKVANTWNTGRITIGGQSVATATLAAKPSVTLVFLRLPDGGLGGAGYASTGFASLPKLDDGRIQSISAIDGTATYTRATLSQAFLDLMTNYAATSIHTQDWGKNYGDDDHDDHIMVAHLTRDVSAQYMTPHTITRYVDYQNDNWPQNVLGDDLTNKIAAFNAYAAHDAKICYPVESATCANNYEIQWIKRQIFETLTVNPAPVVTPTPTAPAPTTPAPAPVPVPTQTATPLPSAPVPVPKPAESGNPKVAVADTTLTSKQFATAGVTATFTGLTPGKSYQPSFKAGDTGVLLGKPIVANAQGVVSGTWKPNVRALPALATAGSFQLRLQGLETTLDMSKAFTVKDSTALSWKVAHRTGKKVVLTVIAKQASSIRTVLVHRVDILFQKRVHGHWKTVATDLTNSKGIASKTVKAGKAAWRAVTVSSGSAWGATSKTVTR